MEASETVLKVKCHCELLYRECYCYCDECKRVVAINRAKAEQAEISFETGQRDGYMPGVVVGKFHGRKEVTNWVATHKFGNECDSTFCLSIKEWESQLKAWGLAENDPDEGLELRPEIEKRLRKSQALPKEKLLSEDGMERKLAEDEPGKGD